MGIHLFPALLYGSENWTLTKSQASHIQAAGLRLLRHVAEHTLQDCRRNASIWQKLTIVSILNSFAQCQLKWLGHLTQTDAATSSDNY